MTVSRRTLFLMALALPFSRVRARPKTHYTIEFPERIPGYKFCGLCNAWYSGTHFTHEYSDSVKWVIGDENSANTPDWRRCDKCRGYWNNAQGPHSRNHCEAVSRSTTLPIIYGDGWRDDTAAVNAMLDGQPVLLNTRYCVLWSGERWYIYITMLRLEDSETYDRFCRECRGIPSNAIQCVLDDEWTGVPESVVATRAHLRKYQLEHRPDRLAPL